jgi:hypothetical protein
MVIAGDFEPKPEGKRDKEPLIALKREAKPLSRSKSSGCHIKVLSLCIWGEARSRRRNRWAKAHCGGPRFFCRLFAFGDRAEVRSSAGRTSGAKRSFGDPTITLEAKAWLTSLSRRKAKELDYPHELWTTRAARPPRSRARSRRRAPVPGEHENGRRASSRARLVLRAIERQDVEGIRLDFVIVASDVMLAGLRIDGDRVS